MTLNKQLVCVSLLLLSLPWAGCQYLKEMDFSLRLGQETSLQATAKVIAQALQQSSDFLAIHTDSQHISPTEQAGFYCHPLAEPIWVDGYGEEWRDIPWSRFNPENGRHSLRYRCVVTGDQVALFFSVQDEQVIYNNPARSLASNGDRLILATGAGREYIFTAVAPGLITARYLKNQSSTYRESRIEAAWVDHSDGYQLEIKMPMSLTQGRLSYRVVDESANGVSNYGPLLEQALAPRFVYQSSLLEQAIAPFTQPGLRLRLIDSEGWLIASAGEPEIQNAAQAHWLLSKLYRALLLTNGETRNDYHNGVNFMGRKEVNTALSGATGSRWYRDPARSSHQILTAAVPIMHEGETLAVLVAEQSSEQTAGLTDQAFSRLFLLSFAVISLTALALLAYANWLSWRIRRLNRATQQALVDQNEITDSYPTSRANDEIDSLTYSYAELMKRIREYTEYLQTLARKLSHELRTPLAIIHSSLDNLASQPMDEKSQTYQQRAKDGALRLGSILTAMSEARRVEESIEHAELERVNIALLLRDISEAYRDTYHNSRFRLVGIEAEMIEAEHNFLLAAPELLVQMLDKLVDNASSFLTSEGVIEISYRSTPEKIGISVSNDGPLLPEAMQSQLFDNMVSVRESAGVKPHLGMGLHIVDLIVKFHGGAVSAANRDDGSGVVFSIKLPRA